MPRGLASSTFMKPFVVLALPGMYLFYKYSQYRQQQQEQNRRKVTERELAHLNHKIDKLLTKLDENEPELATSQEDECVICVNAKATMQTSPCGHRVVCRKCFVKTIQMAVSQRLLPLRCVICRAKILRLKQSGGGGGIILPHGSKGWAGLASSTSNYTVGNSKWLVPGSASSYSMGKTWVVPSSASQYSMANDGSVPNSESLYSMSSGSSSFSGVSSVSSATTSSQGSSKSGKCSSRLNYPRQPTGSLRKSQTQAMKLRIQDYKEPMRAPCIREPSEKPARLPPIAEFQREYRVSKERSGSSSTRIRCAQKIVTQLETTPLLKASPTSSPSASYFRSPLKPANQVDKRLADKRREVNDCAVKTEKEENLDNKKTEEKIITKKQEASKKETKVEKKDEKKDAKTEKKESKAEKEERKKEAKAEKKLMKLEAKAKKKEEKKEAKEAKEAAKAAEKRDKV